MNRQPKDVTALAAAVRQWLATEPGDEEADLALELVMVEQGVTASGEGIQELEGGPDADDHLWVELDDGQTFKMTTAGEVVLERINE